MTSCENCIHWREIQSPRDYGICNNKHSIHYEQPVAKDNRCIDGEAGEVEKSEDLPF